MFLKRKAQGLLEYTLLLGAIIAIVVVVLMGKNGIGNATKTTYQNAGKAMNSTMSSASSDIGVFNGVPMDTPGASSTSGSGSTPPAS